MKGVKKYYWLLFFLLPLPGMAQQQLKGILSDKSGVLAGATVFIENQEGRILQGVTTNVNGEYVMQIPQEGKGLKVVFSFIGYKTKKVAYAGQTVLNMRLEEDIVSLDEVKVVSKRAETNSMGVATRDLGVARQKIDVSQLQELPVVSVEDMLQGKLANVDIISSSGDPGSRSSIRIRGTGSLNASSEPLIVVDGVAYETEISDDFKFENATNEDFGALVNIAPSDIQSIEVLKDAAATAVWGARAANGVLLITTKRGQMGPPRFSVSQKFNFSHEPQGIPLLNGNEYVTMVQDAMWNRYVDEGFTWSRPDYKEIQYDPSYNYFNEYNQNTDWLGLITQNSFNSETNFSMSGGGEKVTYRLSAGYLTETGTTIGTSFKRLTTRFNLDYRFSDRFRVGAIFSYADGNRKNNYIANYPAQNVRLIARRKMPNMSPWRMDADGNATDIYFIDQDANLQSYYNPLAMVNESKGDTRNRSTRVQFNLNYYILSSLQLQADMAFDLGSSRYNAFQPASAYGTAINSTGYNYTYETVRDEMTITSNMKLIYNKNFAERHQVVGTGMFTSRDYSSKYYLGSAGNAIVDDPAAGARPLSINSAVSANRSVAFLANVHYGFDERYLLTAGLRYEGNSRIGKSSRWGTFPSLSASWRISNEYFLREKEWLSELKLRFSWGQSGTSPTGNYDYIGSYISGTSYLDMPSIQPEQVQLNRLKWETVTQANWGVDFSMLNEKIRVVMEYYTKTTDDLLQKKMAIQSTTGFTTYNWYNSGKLRNKGWEIMVDLTDIIKIGDFAISFSNLNLSRNVNEVLELPTNVDYKDYTFGNLNYAYNVQTGNPLGAFYGYRSEGVYSRTSDTYAKDEYGNQIFDIEGNPVRMRQGDANNSPRTARAGDAAYADINYDGVIDEHDIVYLGNCMPVLTAGGSAAVSWKGLRLRVSLHSRIGQKVLNRARAYSEQMSGADNQSRAVLRRWRFEGDETDIPRALYGNEAGVNYNTLGSDRFVEDASFLRLQDIMLSYTLPRSLTQKWKLSRVNCYVIAYNVKTWSKYTGQDPEVGISTDRGVYQLAIDDSYTPKPSKIALGISVDF